MSTYTNRPPPGLCRDMRQGDTTTLRVGDVTIYLTADSRSRIYIDAPPSVAIQWPKKSSQNPREGG